jgi:hypothetical protein
MLRFAIALLAAVMASGAAEGADRALPPPDFTPGLVSHGRPPAVRPAAAALPVQNDDFI